MASNALGTVSFPFSVGFESQSDLTEVICAFPVSGQYGPGSRILYYALVLVCIFGSRNEWLRASSLAAALLFPAVAAVHAIVLAVYSTWGESLLSLA